MNSKTNAFVSFVAAGLGIFGCTAAAMNAVAGDSPAMHTKVVSYSDLNLDTQAGAAVFYRRIESAADEVCTAFDGRDLWSRTQRQKCFDAAVSGSVSQVHKAMVTAMHKQAAGRLS